MNENEDGGILTKALTNDEIIQIPENIRKKLETYFDDRFSELFASKAIGETAKNTLGKC